MAAAAARHCGAAEPRRKKHLRETLDETTTGMAMNMGKGKNKGARKHRNTGTARYGGEGAGTAHKYRRVSGGGDRGLFRQRVPGTIYIKASGQKGGSHRVGRRKR